MEGEDGGEGGKRRVCVVGSGISGLGAAYVMQASGRWETTVLESEASCGGHTLTDTTDATLPPVDLGFQVCNVTNYPHLMGLFQHLGVDTEESDMSFSMSVDGGALEWSSNKLLAQPSNALRPAFLMMVREIVRFGGEAPEVLAAPAGTDDTFADMTLGEYLALRRYSSYFQHNYVLPMCAAVWSTPNSVAADFPVQAVVRFWVNHHLLNVMAERPTWRVVSGRSQSYVRKVLARLPDVRTGVRVARIEERPDGTFAVFSSGDKLEVVADKVVFATHSDVTLGILGASGGATAQEAAVLGAIKYQPNDVYLHSDPALMPRRRSAWASWNCIDLSKNNEAGHSTRNVAVSYWLNHLQNLPEGTRDVFCTLNPLTPPRPEAVVRKLTLAHPILSADAVRAQAQVPALQGSRGGLYFCGAWTGYGFHEDGLRSAVAVAELLGCRTPWEALSAQPHKTNSLGSWADMQAFRLFSTFAKTSIQKGSLHFILPNGRDAVFGDKGDDQPGAHHAVIRVFNMRCFRRMVISSDIGLGEGYMFGEYDCDDPVDLMRVICVNGKSLAKNSDSLGIANWVGVKVQQLEHVLHANTIEGSKRNISAHYDVGNDLYKLFLDETMTYSSGVFLTPGDSLYQSQLNKLDKLIAAAGIKDGDRVLEIGSGWGSMAVRCCQKFPRVKFTTLTVSEEQRSEADARIRAAGLADHAEVLFCDYREYVAGERLGSFDAVLSCEMIEAVGHENLPAYFAVIAAALKPGAKAALQAITEPDERYEVYRNSSDFIRKYIFPGGHLPSEGAMRWASGLAGLAPHAQENIGPDYAPTLRMWHDRFIAGRDVILGPMGHSTLFYRTWRFYFAFCEAAFESEYIYNLQIVFRKPLEARAAAVVPAAAAPTQGIVSRLVAKAYWSLRGGSKAATAAERAGVLKQQQQQQERQQERLGHAKPPAATAIES